ncbi:tetrahydromethanopterin S-methyltransferase subunit E [Methanolapillus millepedarum]|uniref:Tetrahydromethanopterin S-methyltransferase subunit E n=1 Tax=Methanolapillus millepedarum TaxID=3028296 RepID=A0AA96ZUM2_9EURY|nr:hypothetical protein MsAc7_13350 [Methanosarcinaceae archaeon Ac7]
MDPLFGMGFLALVGAAAAIAGWSEDLESDVGSQSNPNSQVQLAPQMGFPHRLFNKAISGEPLSNAMMCTIGGTVAVIFMTVFGMTDLFSIVAGALLAAAIHGMFSATSFMGRISSQSRFKQPFYKDVLRSHLPVIVAYAFLTIVSILIISDLMIVYLKAPIPLPIIAFLLGISAGSIGSAIGDVHYGAERLFQNMEFGAGINASYSGNIVRKAESGIRSGFDNVWFCAKFGGPATGITVSAVVFLTSWIILLFNPAYGTIVGWAGVLAGLLMILVLFAANRVLEKSARKKFGPYREEEKTEMVE